LVASQQSSSDGVITEAEEYPLFGSHYQATISEENEQRNIVWSRCQEIISERHRSRGISVVWEPLPGND
jgi:hypothetical protein